MVRLLLGLMVYFSFGSLCLGQSIKGKLLAKADSSALAYGMVSDSKHNFGVVADVNGIFEIKLRKANDTLLIHSLGYKLLKIPVMSVVEGQFLAIYLEQEAIALAEIKISKRDIQAMSLGNFNKKTNATFQNCVNQNTQVANFISNKGIVGGRISQVSFYIRKEGVVTTPFRVRIYEATPDGKPGKDLLLKNVITSAKKGNRWHTVKIDTLGIPFTENGIFVAMEWLYQDNSKYITQEKFDRTPCFGQVIGLAPVINHDDAYWGGNNQGKWHHLNNWNLKNPKLNPYFEAMINIGVDY